MVKRLQEIYQRAGNAGESYSFLRTAIAETFAGLTAAEKKRLCADFGIVGRPKSGKHAQELVTRRIVERLESAKRCQF